EPDGLAMSSRNVYLSPEERHSALVLPRALDLARKMVLEWGLRDADLVRESLEDYIRQKPRVQVDYISIADEDTLEEIHHAIDRPALVLLAARVGATRLIDNTLLVPQGVDVPEGLQRIIEDMKTGMREHGGAGV
ncbi:MAG: pantoate--beta-alanine ligase, partial [Chloroflexi bacterium]|nr:pantoate--beta-alanine ligase [Chloroflexota bacterium]